MMIINFYIMLGNIDSMPTATVLEVEPESQPQPDQTVSLPEIDDLDAFLGESEKVFTVATMTAADVDGLIKERQIMIHQVDDLETLSKKCSQRVVNSNTCTGLAATNYADLMAVGLIDAAYVERLQKMDELISKFQAVEHLPREASVKLAGLEEKRKDFQDRMAVKIQEKQEKLGLYQGIVREEIKNHFAQRIEKLIQGIAGIETNPHVKERLQVMKEAEQEALKVKQQAAARQAALEQQQLAKKVERFIQSIGAKHVQAFQRLEELTGEAELESRLLRLMNGKDEQQKRSVLESLRNQLIKAIIEGEDEGEEKGQLKSPAEVVPWQMGDKRDKRDKRGNKIIYCAALDFLAEPAMVAQLKGTAQQKDVEQLISSNHILRRLFGKRWLNDNGQQKPGRFWAAFEQRQENDRQGITAVRKQKRAEIAQEKLALEQTTKDILARGGFLVDVPLTKLIKGKQVVAGRERAVIRLEKVQSSKGNECWEVVELLGVSNGLIKIGDRSPLNLQSFPAWLRDAAAHLYYKQRG